MIIALVPAWGMQQLKAATAPVSRQWIRLCLFGGDDVDTDALLGIMPEADLHAGTPRYATADLIERCRVE